MDDDGVVHVVSSGYVHTDDEQTLPFSLWRIGSEMVGLTWPGFATLCTFRPTMRSSTVHVVFVR